MQSNDLKLGKLLTILNSFHRWSPYSYQNNMEKYVDDDEKRYFNLKECLWFCMTSLTPQGGGKIFKKSI